MHARNKGAMRRKKAGITGQVEPVVEQPMVIAPCAWADLLTMRSGGFDGGAFQGAGHVRVRAATGAVDQPDAQRGMVGDIAGTPHPDGAEWTR